MTHENNHPKDFSKTTIESNRLILEPVSLEYTQQMLEELTEEVTRYMAIYPPKSLDDEVAFVNSSIEKMRQGSELTISVFDKQTHEFLGGAGIHKIDTKTPEFGIWIKKSAHGKKIGREVVAALKHWADQNLEFDYLAYPVDKDNTPSRKIAEALGGIIVSEDEVIFPSGKKINEVVYHIS